jgi:hypothetical protein
MIVLGLLLMLVAAGAVTFVLMAPAATSKAIELTAFGVTVNATPLASFIAGAVALVLLGLGFRMVSRGTRRNASSRKELRELRKGQATAAAPSSSQAGQHSSRRDRPENDSTAGSTGTSTDTSTDTSTSTSGDTDTGTKAESSG